MKKFNANLFALVLIALPAVSYAGVTDLFKSILGSDTKPASSQPSAPPSNATKLQKMAATVPRVSLDSRGFNIQNQKGATSASKREVQDISQTLPEIDTFAVPVMPKLLVDNMVAVEIFASTEKSTDPKQGAVGTDNWLNQVARAFNGTDFKTKKGKTGKVTIRRIASGTGYQFIARQKFDELAYVPTAFSPSSSFWVRMLEAQGIKTVKITDRLLGNVAGVVVSKAKLNELKLSETGFSIADLVSAVNGGRLKMGYTNPFESTTGLNFLSQVLQSIGQTMGKDPLSAEVAQKFREFQRGVPMLYETTLQMRDAVEKGTGLDAFVMEYQTFVNIKELASKFAFIPFGERHDNPLYAVGNVQDDELEVLTAFAEFAKKSTAAEQAAAQAGFDHRAVQSYFPRQSVAGDILVSMQRVWKNEKSAGAPVAAIFLSDISGSMSEGKDPNHTRISMLREALVVGSNFINPKNKVGLMLFDDKVTEALPIRTFTKEHKDQFVGIANGLRAMGGTSMYDGIAVALNDLITEARLSPETKLVLIVLSDGASGTDRLNVSEVKEIVATHKVPLYVIGLDASTSLMDDLRETARRSGGDAFPVSAAEVINKISGILNSQL